MSHVSDEIAIFNHRLPKSRTTQLQLRILDHSVVYFQGVYQQVKIC